MSMITRLSQRGPCSSGSIRVASRWRCGKPRRNWLRRAYAFFGIPSDDARERAIRRWMQQDQDGHAKGPRHAYRLYDYGLDYAAIDRVMGDYMRAFGVQLER